MTTIKYSPTGDELWVRRYNGSADDNDYAYRVALDSSGNVYVTGPSVETGSDNDITTIKYSPDGDVLWTQHYDGPANGYDAGQAIAVDANGNAYVTGNHTTATGLDCATLKYSTDGELLWAASYNGPDNSGDVLISIALDDLANAYVSGFVASGGASDFVTIKYDTTGVEQWVQLYNGPGNSYDGTYVIAVDNNRDVLVTGYSTGVGTDYDYTTIKYTESQKPTPTPTVTPTPTATSTPRPTPSPRPRPTPRPRP
jgi:WD40 repeat protein